MANRTADQIAKDGAARTYDDKSDFKSGCAQEGGTFVQIDTDGGTWSAESYRCVWYN
jgi:hypothetical protein